MNAHTAFVAAGSADTQRFKPRYDARDAKVVAVVKVLEAELEASFTEGPGYTLPELQAMRDAERLGEEGCDAARLWDAEIKRHYRDDREATLAALRSEVETYPAPLLDDILALRVPASVSPGWRGRPNTWLVRWPVLLTEARREAHRGAIERSLDSTPAAWAALYPERAPFTFERFAIDKAQLVGA